MSLLLRAAAAAAQRGLGRMPSAVTTTTMHGRRTMASSSSAGTKETMEGAWLVRMGFWWCVGTVINGALETKMRQIAGEAHAAEINSFQEEINSIRDGMKTLRESNEELLAVLKRPVRTREE